MPKAATGWLFDQLKHHPDFWLPPTKEISYLSPSTTRVKSAEKWLVQLERPEKANRLRRWANRRPDDTRDLEFLKDMTSRIGQSMDLAIYRSLFRFKENALSGDLSSGYGALAPDVLSQLQTHLPHTKIILLVRDPVERAWSHLSMWHRVGHIEEGVLECPDALRQFLTKSGKFQKLSFATAVASAWKKHAPKLAFRYYLFDDVVLNPRNARSEILRFLGADPEKVSGALSEGHNYKSRKKKLFLENHIRDILVEHFREELKACARMFGGAAECWPSRYGLA